MPEEIVLVLVLGGAVGFGFLAWKAYKEHQTFKRNGWRDGDF